MGHPVSGSSDWLNGHTHIAYRSEIHCSLCCLSYSDRDGLGPSVGTKIIQNALFLG